LVALSSLLDDLISSVLRRPLILQSLEPTGMPRTGPQAG
jgi:hypothetical protein